VSVLRDKALGFLHAAAAALEAERSHINDLNVYPVPDGDTGTNLFLTMRAVIDELEGTATPSPREVLTTISKGSLMGARGNSGVILSQMVRGACEGLASHGVQSPAAWTATLREASDSAYRAVREPVEGTMLTVMRRMAEAAEEHADAVTLEELAAHVLEAGRLAVEETVEQLEALRRAGVVDAGGYGLLVLARGAASGLLGAAVQAPVRTVAAEGGLRRKGGHIEGIPDDDHEAASLYRYCTSFLLAGGGIDREALEDFVLTQGDCVLVVGSDEMVKVHVHTDHPGAVLSHADTLGSIDVVEVADMREQTLARDRRLALVERTAAVAVAVGEGNKELFRELGCEALVDGGQSMNPSAAELVQAVEALDATEVVLLPNNANVVLAAEQAAGMCDRAVSVVHSTSMPAGLSAMVSFDPEAGAAANAAAMDEAVAHVHTGEVTRAVRDSEIDGVSVRKDQVIGIVDGRLAASGDDLKQVFAGVLAAFAVFDPEVVTVLTSLNGSGLGADELVAVGAETLPGAEVLVHAGGQPLYPILVGAE
jgi:hypothetical protein